LPLKNGRTFSAATVDVGQGLAAPHVQKDLAVLRLDRVEQEMIIAVEGAAPNSEIVSAASLADVGGSLAPPVRQDRAVPGMGGVEIRNYIAGRHVKSTTARVLADVGQVSAHVQKDLAVLGKDGVQQVSIATDFGATHNSAIVVPDVGRTLAPPVRQDLAVPRMVGVELQTAIALLDVRRITGGVLADVGQVSAHVPKELAVPPMDGAEQETVFAENGV
jgi:hypothetical protein